MAGLTAHDWHDASNVLKTNTNNGVSLWKGQIVNYGINVHVFSFCWCHSSNSMHVSNQWTFPIISGYTVTSRWAWYHFTTLLSYRIDEREDRIPAKILVAECLYEGCIVNKHEDKTYNSVPVLATITVLQKTVCPGNPRHYLVTVDSVTIPVACTCVVPRQMISSLGLG